VNGLFGLVNCTKQTPFNRIGIAYYKREHPNLIRIDPFASTQMLTLNVGRTPLNNQKVRFALSLAIDRDAIVRHVTRGDQKPAFGFTPPGIGSYEPCNVVHFDPDRARQLSDCT
jgi:oligopeptide transport system substrate-binding protein